MSSLAAEDPYEKFLVEQSKRKIEQSSSFALKKAKVAANEPEARSSQPDDDEMSSIKKQLDAKNEECALLRKQILDLQQANADAEKRRQESQETFCKVSKQLSRLYVNSSDLSIASNHKFSKLSFTVRARLQMLCLLPREKYNCNIEVLAIHNFLG